MRVSLTALAVEAVRLRPEGGATEPRSSRTARHYLQTMAMLARAEAEFLDAVAADVGSADQNWEHVPGPKSLTPSQIKAVWDGVNEDAKRLLGAFATRGGDLAQEDAMSVLGVDEARLLNGPLGGISRRVKKLLGDSEATFYSIHPETKRYVLPATTFEALCDVIERERPELLSKDITG